MKRLWTRLFGGGRAADGTSRPEDAAKRKGGETPPELKDLENLEGLGQEITDLARHPDPQVRRTLASKSDLTPELLYFLAGDDDADVRRRIAANAATPAKADALLAKDKDERVRCDLARKIAAVAPRLSADERKRVKRTTYQVLEDLARDQIPRVRQIIAETLKDVAEAPPEVIRRLARDAELAVSAPVLQYSPVLSEEDLLEIIAASPVDGALSAISRRAQVPAEVADAIARSDDVQAITLLLDNASAQIREETLDLLIDRAPAHEAWHSPLVNRPHLHAGAAVRLACFVADSLIEALKARKDLDAATLDAVSRIVRRRIEQEGGGPIPMSDPDVVRMQRERAQENAAETPAAEERVRAMQAAGTLTEDVILKALWVNDTEFITAALAARARLPEDTVRAMLGSQDPKAVAALARQAELSATAAAKVQLQAAQITPDQVLRPTRGGDYALSPDEMDWQVRYFSEAARPPGP